jgi:hypothetical protein
LHNKNTKKTIPPTKVAKKKFYPPATGTNIKLNIFLNKGTKCYKNPID